MFELYSSQLKWKSKINQPPEYTVNPPTFICKYKLFQAKVDLPIVPTPMSPFVIKVPITFVNNSGDEVAMAMNEAPAIF